MAAEEAEQAEEAASGAANSPFVVVVAALAALAILVATMALLGGQGRSGSARDRRSEAAEVAAAWLDAFERVDLPALRALVAPGTGRGLAPAVESFPAGTVVTEPSPPRLRGDEADVRFSADVEVPALGTWSYDGSLRLVDVEVPVPGSDDEDDVESQWRVAFSPAAMHPALVEGRRLEVATTFAPRGRPLAADGSPLDAPALRSVVGTVGPATAEQVAALGPAYPVGHPVGQSGLQAGFERQLAGTPSGEVRVVGPDGAVVSVEASFVGEPGRDVRTTLEPAVVAAAGTALGADGKPAALVAIRPSTGAVVAIANRPSHGFNRALLGRYPPGSTFKVVTTTALLANGVTPATRTSCPSEITIEGRTMSNAEDEALGEVDFARAFFKSCNTAFLALARELAPEQLVAAARRLGFDRDPALGTAAATSQFPEPSGTVDKVAAAIGQGRVLATPLQMASVAASVAAGGYRPPFVVAPPTPVPFDPLPEGMAATLQDLMRRVVAEGTGTAARLPGSPVAGKTGTAEFGTARPPRTHAWFIGFRDDLAVAVVVEDGGFGGEVAAPLAAGFLRRAAA